MNNETTLRIKFAILQVAYWCAYASFTSFATSLLLYGGTPVTIIGTAVAFQTGGAFLGQMVLSVLCDRRKTNKWIFVIASAVTMLAYGLVYTFRTTSWVILCFALLGFVQQPSTSVLDTWILKRCQNPNQVYGPIRSTGSFAFALFTGVYGGILNSRGYGIMPAVAGIFLALAVTVACITPDAPRESYQTRQKKEGPSGKESIQMLLRNRAVLFLLATVFLVGIGITCLINLMPVILESVGGNVSHQGIALLVSAMLEVPFLFLSVKMTRLDPIKRILLSTLIASLSMIGIHLARASWMVIVCAGLRGAHYGLFLPSMRQAFYDCSPAELQTTTQSAGDALYNCLAGVIGNNGASLLIAARGVPFMGLCMAGFEIVAAALIGIYLWCKRRSFRR